MLPRRLLSLLTLLLAACTNAGPGSSSTSATTSAVAASSAASGSSGAAGATTGAAATASGSSGQGTSESSTVGTAGASSGGSSGASGTSAGGSLLVVSLDPSTGATPAAVVDIKPGTGNNATCTTTATLLGCEFTTPAASDDWYSPIADGTSFDEPATFAGGQGEAKMSFAQTSANTVTLTLNASATAPANGSATVQSVAGNQAANWSVCFPAGSAGQVTYTFTCTNTFTLMPGANGTATGITEVVLNGDGSNGNGLEMCYFAKACTPTDCPATANPTQNTFVVQADSTGMACISDSDEMELSAEVGAGSLDTGGGTAAVTATIVISASAP